MKSITIIGSGLAGSLLALYLERRGYNIDIFESRPDLRKNAIDYGRSINLALSCRGITGLTAINMMRFVDSIRVPMRGRAIHQQDGQINYQSFGRNDDEYINAISRNALNALLLDQAEKCSNIKIHFEHKLMHMDLETKKLQFETNEGVKTYNYQRIIGADGAGSVVREHLKQKGIVESSREFLPHSYKELSISSSHTVHMAREHLHLWPRNSFLLLGNPNPDDSITGSLFLATKGEDSFESLNTEEAVNTFFKNAFPDAYQAMPNLVEEFFSNATGNMSTVHCAPWFYKDECLLIADAAHGIVPFFGQGMNCAFEDCRILDELLDTYQDDWQQVIPKFYKVRKNNTDAVAKLSMANYTEIQSDIRSPKFLLEKLVERELMLRYPHSYVSMHVLVMFTNTSYAKAKAINDIQTSFLQQICSPINHIKEVDWEKVTNMITKYDEKLTNMKEF